MISIKSRFLLLPVSLFVLSCTSEKLSLSPVYNYPSGTEINYKNIKNTSTELFYASELTNQISTIPTFSNTGVNREISNLKYHIKDYVYALQERNPPARSHALKNIEKSYKKVQKLRPYLKEDENQTINRYLVRMKSNISQLEYLKEKPKP